MNFEGLIIGVIAFLLIGVFHPIVIKAEYYFSPKIWPMFAVAGMIFLVIALFIEGTLLNVSFSILGITCLWSIHELFEQERRVKRGWFPENHKRLEKNRNHNRIYLNESEVI